MKRIMMALLIPSALLFAGCSSSGTIHHTPLFGDPVGDIICIEDKEHGTLIYKLVQGTGKAQMVVLVKEGSEWKEAEK